MHLHAGEPEAGPWDRLGDDALTERVRSLLPDSGRTLILVDGRSGSGKSTVGDRLARLLHGVVVHSDDIAWHLHPVDWAETLADGVLTPWRRGEPVVFRPPGWVAKGRPGAVEVPPCRVLLVEGVGAGRAVLAADGDLVVWVQSDRVEARRRALVRDVELGRPREEAEAFWEEWMRSEEPFLASDRPWTRAALIVYGTPPGNAPGRTFVASGPLDPLRTGRP
jgi:hypothetical protein